MKKIEQICITCAAAIWSRFSDWRQARFLWCPACGAMQPPGQTRHNSQRVHEAIIFLLAGESDDESQIRVRMKPGYDKAQLLQEIIRAFPESRPAISGEENYLDIAAIGVSQDQVVNIISRHKPKKKEKNIMVEETSGRTKTLATSLEAFFDDMLNEERKNITRTIHKFDESITTAKEKMNAQIAAAAKQIGDAQKETASQLGNLKKQYADAIAEFQSTTNAAIAKLTNRLAALETKEAQDVKTLRDIDKATDAKLKLEIDKRARNVEKLKTLE